MSEFLLRFSSKNRQKSGISFSHDFTTRFNNPIKLSSNMKHELAARTISMTYSWYNIRQSYGNNQIKYTSNKGVNWKTITFIDGMYSYDDIDEYIKKSMKDNGDLVKKADDNNGQDEYGINIYFVLSTYRVLVKLNENYYMDLRDLDFRKLIGFDSKKVEKTEYGDFLPDITRWVDEVHIN